LNSVPKNKPDPEPACKRKIPTAKNPDAAPDDLAELGEDYLERQLAVSQNPG
jgi:hypothetical protein